MSSRALAAVVLFLGTLWVFSPAIRFDFVDYDDPIYVTNNPLVARGFTWEGVARSWHEWISGNWHPLTIWSHMLDATLFGLRPWGHHLHSLLLHALNAVLLFFLLGAIAQKRAELWAAFFIAAIWAVHPTALESAVWISERKNVLSTLLWLATLALYKSHTQKGTTRSTLLALASFGLALMAKPAPVVLPVTLLLLDYWPLKRVQGISRADWATWRALLAEKIPFFVLSIVFALSTLKTQLDSGAAAMGVQLPLWVQWAWVPVWYAKYVAHTFWPVGLSVLYPEPKGGPPLALSAIAALGLAILTIGLLIYARHRPWIGVGWLWFIITLAPVSGIIPIGLHSIADRYLYVPTMGLWVAIGWTAASASSRIVRRSAGAFGIGAVLVLVMLTRHQLPHWRNSETLFSRAIAVTKGNYVMHYNLARYLTLSGRYDEALDHLQACLSIKPDHAEALNNMGWTLQLKGNYAEAASCYRRSLHHDPQNHLARRNLVLALLALGYDEEAIAEFNELVRVAPVHPAVGELKMLLEARAAKRAPQHQLPESHDMSKP